MKPTKQRIYCIKNNKQELKSEMNLREIRRKPEGRELLSRRQDSANRKSYESQQNKESRKKKFNSRSLLFIGG
jgi:hypothetical protein